MKTFKDTDLREALRRKYADVPQMPLNLGERIMKEAPLNSSQEKETPSRSSSRNWVWGGLLAAAASIALLLVMQFGMKDEGIGMKDEPTVAVREARESNGIRMKDEPTVAVRKARESNGIEKLDEAPLATPNKVKKVKRKAVRKSNFAMPAPTDADRTLAETEAAPEEERPARAHLSPEQEVLLAMEAREQDFRSRGKRLQREIEEMMRN